MKAIVALVAAAGALVLAGGGHAAEYEVKMLNKGADKQVMVFEPAFLHVQPGDTVHFIPTDKSHDAQSITGMIPASAEPFKGKPSEEIAVTFSVPGLYGFRCTPHFAMGMVGLIEVGDGSGGIEAASTVKLPPMADKRMKILLAKVAAGVE
jgi:pseudoazurin